MIIKGSLGYDQHGRKRKQKRKTRSSNGLGQLVHRCRIIPCLLTILEAARKHREKYPSMPIGEYKPEVDTSYKKEVSKNYTVSIAYNKGSYQVIPKDDVEHIVK